MSDIKNPELDRFFATFPLYRPFPVQSEWTPPRIILREGLRTVLPCGTCGERRSFSLDGDDDLKMEIGEILLVRFRCTHCRTEEYRFAIRSSKKGNGFRLQKVGQYPTVRAELDPALEKVLDQENRDLFSKGLTAESHGFGIGAFAYYRRVIENIIEVLLASLAAFAEQEGDTAFRAAVETAKGQQRASDKINAVKDLLPPSLRPGGFNPLGKLFEVLSDGIHSLTDDDCLGRAEVLRVVLASLVGAVAQQQATRDRYKAAAERLLALSLKKE